MTRSMTAAVATAIQADCHPEVLVHFAFDSGAVRLWSGIGDLVWSGNTYTGAGTFGSVSEIAETAAVRANGVAFRLSGIPSSLLSIALTEAVQGRAVTLWVALFDATGALIADPVQIFAGRIDTMQVVDAGETAEITIAAENRLIDLERPLEVRYYSDQDQQREYPGDKGFEFVPLMQEAVIVWGRAKLGAPTQDPVADSPPDGPAAQPVTTFNEFGVPETVGTGAAPYINEFGVPANGAQQTVDPIPDFDTGF